MRFRNKWLLSGLALVVVAGGVGAWFAIRAWKERTLRAGLEEARRDRSGGRAALAASNLRALAEAWPGRADVAYELALAEQARGRLRAARDAIGVIGPGSTLAAKALVLRAQLEIRLGRLSVAETLLNEALDATPRGRPERREIRDALVRLLRSEGRFSEARQFFVDGFDEWPDPVAALRALYRLDVDPYPVDGVRRYLENSARQEPEDDRVWLGRGYLATRLGEFDEAERWLDACRDRRPADPVVWRARLNWALAANKPDAVREAVPHLPADAADAERIRAWFARRIGRTEDEQAALEKLRVHEPGDIAVINRLAELALAAGQADAAERYRLLETTINRARESYRKTLASPEIRSHATELSALAAAQGLAFESRRWAELANSSIAAKTDGMPSNSASDRSLADLLRELAVPDSASLPQHEQSRLREPVFTDDAVPAGLSFVHDNGSSADSKRLIPPLSASGGVGLLDYDGDGWLDVYCVQGGPFPPDASPGSGGDRLFRNRGNGTFEDATKRSGLAAYVRGYGHGVAVGDFDGDGRPDLFVTRWRAYALYRNKGDGTFEDATHAAGLGGDRDWPTSAAFADFDGDGDLDLYVCHYLRWDENDHRTCVDPDDPAKYQCTPLAFESLPDHLFRNDGGRFVDVTAEAGIIDRDGRGLGVVAADLDQDGKVDIFVANDMSANYLFHNLGGFRFEETAVTAGVAANGQGGYQAGMGVACGDLDGDERPDLVVTNYYGESTTLFQNLGGGVFTDHSAAAGLAAPSRYRLGFGVGVPDVNNDGRLDLLTANGHIHDGRPQFPFAMPLQLFLGTDGGRLVDVTSRAGPPFRLELLARGLAVGDLDNDGRIDALAVAQNDSLVFLHNATERSGHFITLKLEGHPSNRDAVGATVTLRAGDQTHRAWRLGGGSYQSASDPRVHFGINDARQVEQVEIRWPSGRVEKLGPLQADTGYRVREGEGQAKPLEGFSRRNR